MAIAICGKAAVALVRPVSYNPSLDDLNIN